MSHHSDHEIAQKFIQASGVIAVMAKPGQKWGKIMAARNNWLLDNKKARRTGETVDVRDMRQRQ